ncbi:RNA-directed DNA polymerase from mobile element jockey [Eufriesea mexicana]|uniref:RNA-directed DNA polymerase from mobile element jockey n=1 Tax=Eufriesea mexicana TaxID=516756 RepID=A0A310SQE0_9HYME|nr:RNA-directed DNA polymerase from mobile element jockey [Eufriesea mexicana]
MANLKMAFWNSNGLQQRVLEIKTFVYKNNIDILFVSETHFATKSYIKIPYYTVYNSNHPSGKAHGGSAIIIKIAIKHHLYSKFNQEYIQATAITVQTDCSAFQVSAMYAPPRHKMGT